MIVQINQLNRDICQISFVLPFIQSYFMLIPPHNTAGVTRPADPADPPILGDITNARNYITGLAWTKGELLVFGDLVPLLIIDCSPPGSPKPCHR